MTAGIVSDPDSLGTPKTGKVRVQSPEGIRINPAVVLTEFCII